MGYNDKQTQQTWQQTRHQSHRHQSHRHYGGAVRPKKNLGQHFLCDLRVAQSIADTVDACPAIPILEVGPGMGVLTQYLLAKGRPMAAVEIDHESVAYLQQHYPALRCVAADFLTMDINLFGGAPFVLTGNYPYDISSQIFFKLLAHRDLIPCCTGMIQREVALRITSQPNTKAYGILAVLIQAWYTAEYLFTVDEDVFTPPPRVKSAVIRLTRNSTTTLGCDERLFQQVVKTAFNQRRKMLRSSLRGLFPARAPSTEAFLALPWLTLRPEQLTIADFVTLTNSVAEAMHKQL